MTADLSKIQLKFSWEKYSLLFIVLCHAYSADQNKSQINLFALDNDFLSLKKACVIKTLYLFTDAWLGITFFSFFHIFSFGSLLSAMRNHIKVYFEESSIHGFPYIVNSELHLTEKILWVAALIVSFICCGLLIFEIGVKVQEDALVTYTSDAAIEVIDVSSFYVDQPFPIQTSRRFHFLPWLSVQIFWPTTKCSTTTKSWLR